LVPNVPKSQKVVPKVPISAQLNRAEERETAKAANDVQKRVDKRKATLLEHFAKKQKTD